MPQPRKLDRPVHVHLKLPETLMGELHIQLYSEAHGRIPQGKLSGFIEEAARLLLAIRKGEVTVHANGATHGA